MFPLKIVMFHSYVSLPEGNVVGVPHRYGNQTKQMNCRPFTLFCPNNVPRMGLLLCLPHCYVRIVQRIWRQGPQIIPDIPPNKGQPPVPSQPPSPAVHMKNAGGPWKNGDRVEKNP